MPYLVNVYTQALKVGAPFGRRVEPGERLEATAEQAALFYGNPYFKAYSDDGKALDLPEPDWSPKKIVLAPEFQPAATTPAEAPTSPAEATNEQKAPSTAEGADA